MNSDHNYSSPLRYPGGKTKLTTFLEDLILLNNLENCAFYELYAGGAGLSINLLLSGICKKVVLNDLDFHIYAFWWSILNSTDQFLNLLNDTEVNIKNWETQKNIYRDFRNYTILEVGFSTFFLNRTNRSGILHRSGPIGGFDQTGNYKIDVRYNKPALRKRIEKIAGFKSDIEVYNLEAIDIVEDVFATCEENSFVFLDPPYYDQGERLYFNSYEDQNHVDLRNLLLKNRDSHWFLTYDNCQRINDLYVSFRKTNQSMSYTLQEKKVTKEVLIFSDKLHLPKRYKSGAKSQKLILDGV